MRESNDERRRGIGNVGNGGRRVCIVVKETEAREGNAANAARRYSRQ